MPFANSVFVVAAIGSAVFALATGHVTSILACTPCARKFELRDDLSNDASTRSPDPDVENNDRYVDNIASATAVTRSTLPWFSRLNLSIDEPDDWKQVESEYGSRALEDLSLQ